MKYRKLHKREKQFFYEGSSQGKGFLLPTACMLIGSIVYRIQDAFKNSHAWVVQEKPINASEQLAITWIGHSTFLIQVGGINILTDPIFGNISWLFPRILPAGIKLDVLPPIDIILISHNHPDHMNYHSLLALQNHKNPCIVVPLGTKSWFDQHSFNNVFELSWWDQKEINLDSKCSFVKVTFLPAHHWSQHGMFDKNKSLWGSWMIECAHYFLYFAGDTIYSGHFLDISHNFPHIDVAFLPIGPCEPQCWMKHAHMNAQEAGKAFFDLSAQHLLPMHWGTFHFGMESFDLPIKRLQSWQNENSASLEEKVIHFPKVGERIYID